MALTSALITTSITAVYSSAISGSQTGNAITSMIICNYTSGTTATVTLYAVPNNAGSFGTPSNTNMIVYQLSVPPGETVSLDQEKLVLSGNDTISAVASVNSALSITISTLPV
jgi:hypothetical protein